MVGCYNIPLRKSLCQVIIFAPSPRANLQPYKVKLSFSFTWYLEDLSTMQKLPSQEDKEQLRNHPNSYDHRSIKNKENFWTLARWKQRSLKLTPHALSLFTGVKIPVNFYHSFGISQHLQISCIWGIFDLVSLGRRQKQFPNAQAYDFVSSTQKPSS